MQKAFAKGGFITVYFLYSNESKEAEEKKVKKNYVKKLGLGLVSLGILGGLAACGNGSSSTSSSESDEKTLTVSVDSGYKDLHQ